MKRYIVLNYYGQVAIPLESLQACGDIRFVETSWDEENSRVQFHHRGSMKDIVEGKIISEADILPAKVKE